MKMLYLIRHGKTRANEEHLYCGSTDLPLSAGGRAALEPVNLPAEQYVTSGMLRTEQTLLQLFGPVPHRIDPRFREVDFGEFEMKSYGQLREEPAYLAWISGDNGRNVPPGGESGFQMQNRVLEGLEQLLREPEDTVLVTHGGVIACIMEHLFPQQGKNRYQWQPEPGKGYCVFQNGYKKIP